MILAVITMVMIVRKVNLRLEKVLPAVPKMVPREAFWMRPPMIAAMKINTPGVVTHTKVYGLAPSPM